eukprot:Gb_32371 [translate_table: standard]
MDMRNSDAHPLLRGGRAPYDHGFSVAEMESLASICDAFIPSVCTHRKLHSSFNGNGKMAVINPMYKSAQKDHVQDFYDISDGRVDCQALHNSRGDSDQMRAMADVNGWNPSWKAIGYSPPSTPVIAHNNGRRPLEKGIIEPSSEGENLLNILGKAGFDVSTQNNPVIDSLCRHKMGRNSKIFRVKCDVVVVGSGSGGGVAAGTLAEAGYKVLVLEKGKYFAREDLSLIEGPSLDQMYERGGILASADTKISMMAGATVGGGSAINWSASIRTPHHVLKEWANELNLSLFGSQEYQKAMDEVYGRLGVNDRCEKESFQNRVLRRGCSALGYDVTNVSVNATPKHFCGSCCFGCRNGDKKGTCETWLVDAVHANARILTDCEAKEVLCIPNDSGLKGKRAVGVLAMVGSGPEYILVQAEATVIACGSLMTPPLLHASGLRNPNIGKHLHLHPVKMAWGYFPQGMEPEGSCYEGGIITAMCKEGSKWEGSGYGTIIQTPALAPGSFGALMPWVSGQDMKDRMVRYHRTAHLFSLTRDRGSGTVSQMTGVDYKLRDLCDKENLDEGLERALRILIAAGATEVGTHHNDGCLLKIEGASQVEIDKFLMQVRRKKGWCPLISAHQLGSCRMGVDPATSCVDENGESWEVEGLFVSDASVLPTALGVNPMITVESIALCISRRVSQFLQQIMSSSHSSSSSTVREK